MQPDACLNSELAIGFTRIRMKPAGFHAARDVTRKNLSAASIPLPDNRRSYARSHVSELSATETIAPSASLQLP
jgi:hypothetical protein